MDFFDKQEETPIKEELKEVADTIKIGDEEYSLDEAKELVGLGKIGKEAEEKFKTPIDKVWPKTQQVINENKELRDRLEEIEKNEIETKNKAGAELSPEEMSKLVKSELKKYGAVLSDDLDSIFNQKFNQAQEGSKILNSTNDAVSKLKKDFGVEAETGKVLEYMRETGVRDPNIATKLMFEKQIDQVKEERLKTIKPSGLTTTETSQAGSHQPAEVKTTKDNLTALLHEHLEGLKQG